MTLLISLFTLLSNPVFAQNLSLDDLGGPGVKTYDGKNQKAWIYKDCKVIISGSKNTPVIYFSVSDGESVYDYWTYNSSITLSPGYDRDSIIASDSMNLVNPMDSAKVYSNTATSSGTGVSVVSFHTSPNSKTLSLVELNYYSEEELKNEIVCGKLKLRAKEIRN